MDEQADSERRIHYEELYQKIIQEMELMHKDNLKKLKIGFRSLLIVHTVFLIMLFFTGSSKTVFLILWIVSMFIIATVLVRIEYSDYQLQNRINHATDREGAEATSLIEESIENNRSAMHELLMREESRLPFKLGPDNKFDSEDEGEYDTGELLDSQDMPEFDADYEDEAMGHYDEDFGESPISGMTEDDEFIHDSDYYDYDLSNYSGDLSALSKAGSAVEPQISILDDDVDGIDTLLSGGAGKPAEDNVSPGSAEDTEAPLSVPDEQPAAEPDEVPPAAESQAVSSDTGEPVYAGADDATDRDIVSLPDDETVLNAGSAPGEDSGGELVSDMDDDTEPLNEDELPGNITVDDILAEFHKNESDEDYEADFTDAGGLDYTQDDDDDVLGGLDDEDDGKL